MKALMGAATWRFTSREEFMLILPCFASGPSDVLRRQMAEQRRMHFMGRPVHSHRGLTPATALVVPVACRHVVLSGRVGFGFH